MFKLRLAHLLIGVEHRYPYMKDFCAGYISDDPAAPAFTVCAAEDECLREQAASPVPVTLPYCESICLYRRIALELLAYDALLIHAAAIEMDGRCVLFAAGSGTGKTTHIRLWQDAFGERVRVIYGDKPILRFLGGRPHVFGTPFRGKEQLGSNISAPVHALCFLTRGETNHVEPLTPSQALDRIVHQLLIPTDAAQMDRFMTLVERLLTKVDCFLLHCNTEPEAAVVAYEGMKGL